ncbi:HD domain-containing protein [Tissierella praeacuta]|uniref:HD domain-containing protein n=1 Tax=Tissierella praeacuta TaxID=43131 RepID=UPI003DA52D55
MDINISTGLEIAERNNEKMCGVATFNDSMKQEELDKKEETYRTVFRRERDRILYSGGFRRLQDKTQVISAVKTGDHRTRLTHSLEVEQIAVSIADALNLNIDLTSAIAIGHDIGHTPFGHSVERFLDKELKDEGGFSHALESVRYLISNNNKMDVSEEIIEGILKHDTDVFVYDFDKNGQVKIKESYYVNQPPGTLEAQIVYWADKIAYITHDYEDFRNSQILQKNIRDGFIKEVELEEILYKLLNKKVKLADYETRDLVRNIIANLIENSQKNINQSFKYEEIKFKDMDYKEKQMHIRRITMGKIQNYYNEDEEFVFLTGLKLSNITDEELLQRLKEIHEYYKGNKKDNKKMLKDIEELKLIIQERIELKNIINNITNLEILQEQEKIDRYKKLCGMKIDIFKKRISKIKKEAYQKGLIINLSNEYAEQYKRLRNILDNHYIGSPEIQLSDAKAERIVSSLFDMYCNNINILPNEIRKKIEEDIKGIEIDIDKGESRETKIRRINRRNIASYIASMSDRYAEQIYKDLNSTGSHYGY